MNAVPTAMTDHPDGPGTPRFRWILAGLMSIMLLSALDHTIVVTALPLIVSDLGSPEALSAVVTGYMLASALSALWFGQIADFVGRRNTLLACVLGFVVSSAACGLAQSLPQLIVLRVVQGVAAGGLLTLSQTIIADLVQPRERGRYQGYVLSVFGGASVSGPILGGALADQVSWRAIFLVNVPVGIASLFILQRSLANRYSARGRPTSLVSTIALAVAAFLVLLGVSLLGEGRSVALASLLVAGGAVAGICFLVTERRVRYPVFASTSIRSRLYVMSNLSGFGVNAAMMGAVVLMPLYLQGVLGMSAAKTGLVMLPQIGTWLLATLVTGVLISRTGRVKPFAYVGAVLNASGLLLLGTLNSSSNVGTICGFLAVFGLGQGLALQSLGVANQAEVKITEMGQATGLASFSRSVGSVLGVALSGALVALLVGADKSLERALQVTLTASVPIALVGVLFAFLMPEVRFVGRARAQGMAH